MKLFLISQMVMNGYDTFDSAIVAAPDELTALRMRPTFYSGFIWIESAEEYGYWCKEVENVSALCIGDADPTIYSEPTLVLASFNAG